MFPARHNQNKGTEPRYTRVINPRLGWLGFFCLFGFLGFLPDSHAPGGIVTTPLFFMFFAFFGFSASISRVKCREP